MKAGPGLAVGSSQSIFLSLVSEGDGVPLGSPVGNGDGDQTTTTASPGLLGLSPLGLSGPPLGGGSLGSELSAGSLGLGGGSPGGRSAPAPLGLAPAPGGGPGSGAAVGTESGAASPPLLRGLVHGGVSRGAIRLISGGAISVISGSAIAVSGGPLISVVVVVTGGLLSGSVRVSGRGSSSGVGVYRGVIGVVIVISRGSTIAVVSWGRGAIAVLSGRRGAVAVISWGRGTIAVSG